MQLEGLHHITAITGKAPVNVDFYARVLGMRLVKKTVNQDDPTVYHLFYADEDGSAGADLTSLSTRRVALAATAQGWCIRSSSALPARPHSTSGRSDSAAEASRPRASGRAALRRSRGHGSGALVVDRPDAPLVARSLEVPAEHALQGLEGVRAYVIDAARSAALLAGPMGLTRWSPAPGRRAASCAVAASPSRRRRVGASGRRHRAPHRVEHRARRGGCLAGAHGGGRRAPDPP